ncbi:MAG: MgtC/SapB family protein [Candidatus Paceibacterota bacterium]|jgi:putative Mg2+ transporter-C (MgtC) family protein
MEQFLSQNSEIILKLTLAVGLGLLVGVERFLVHRGEGAGMKTHALVSLGSAVFVLISEAVVQKYANFPGFNPIMIPSQIIVGVGFLGAGSIMVYGSQLKGLTTAGGLWVMAGVGMAVGFGFYSLAVITTFLILLILILINMLERPIKKITEERNQPKSSS